MLPFTPARPAAETRSSRSAGVVLTRRAPDAGWKTVVPIRFSPGEAGPRDVGVRSCGAACGVRAPAGSVGASM